MPRLPPVRRALLGSLLAGFLIGACNASAPASAPASTVSSTGAVRSPSASGTSEMLAPDRSIHVRSPFLAVATTAGPWVTSDKAVVHIDSSSAATEIVATAIPGGAASGLAVSSNKLWEADFDSGLVDEVDISHRRVVDAVPVGGGPRGLFIDGDTPWIYQEHARKEVAVDPATGRVAASVAVPGPIGFAFGSWWSTDPGGSELQRLEPHTGRIIATISMPPRAGACELSPLAGLRSVGNALATFCLGNTAAARPLVALVDIAANRVIATVDPRGQPFGGSIVVNGRWWLIEGPTDGPGRLVRIDASSWAVDRTLVVGAQFDPDAAVVVGEELYVPIDPDENLDEVLRFPLASLGG